jgi:hypothetical protein
MESDRGEVSEERSAAVCHGKGPGSISSSGFMAECSDTMQSEQGPEDTASSLPEEFLRAGGPAPRNIPCTCVVTTPLKVSCERRRARVTARNTLFRACIGTGKIDIAVWKSNPKGVGRSIHSLIADS